MSVPASASGFRRSSRLSASCLIHGVAESKRPSAQADLSIGSKAKKQKVGGKTKAPAAAPRSGSLSKVMRTYKGLDDFHIPLFEAVHMYTKASHVLYPGCHRHVQASLVFPDVTFIDSYKGVEAEFTNEAVLEWIRINKRYEGDSRIEFMLSDFTSDMPLEESTYELLISMSAGIVSTSCGRFVRPGGYFLVSDAHFDARLTSIDERFRLCAVYDFTQQKLLTSEADLEGHFVTNAGTHISQEQIDVSIAKPKNRRGFSLVKEALFYLFQKVE